MAAPTPRRLTVENPTFNMLIYGRPGAGKTTFAATAQDCVPMQNTLLINIEGGELSIAHRGDILVVDVKRIEELDEVFWAIQNRHSQNSPYKGINTVIIDSATELQTLDLEAIVKKEVDAKTNPKRVSYDDIWRDDYGKSTTRMKRALRWFRDSDLNFILTALPKEIYASAASENAVPTEIKPSLTAKLADSVMGYMDFVWYMYANNEGKRFLITSDAQNQQRTWFRAKTRGQRFAETITQTVADPSLPMLYETFIAAESGWVIDKNGAKPDNTKATPVTQTEAKTATPAAKESK